MEHNLATSGRLICDSTKRVRLRFIHACKAAGVNNNNDESIWFESADNQLVLVARENDPAPGVPGAIFSGLLSASALNDAGQLLLSAQLAGPGVGSDERAYWLYDSGGLTLVARERNPAPGMGPGWSFQDFFGAALNNHGQMVFGASAVNGLQFTQGIWALEPGGDLRLVVRSDDTFDVDNGPGVDLRSIFSIDFQSNSASGHPDGFNDRNELVVEVVFNEPSHGIFVLAIPEPNTFTISLCACIALASRRIALCNSRTRAAKQGSTHG